MGNSLYLLRSRKILYLFILLNILDCALTAIIINYGGMEVNHWRFSNIWLKLPVAFAIMWLVRRNEFIMKWITAGMIAVVLWNCLMLSLMIGG